MRQTTLNWTRIAAMSTTMAAHVVFALLIALPLTNRDRPVEDEKPTVVNVTFLGADTGRVASPPPSPPPSPPTPPKPVATKKAPVRQVQEVDQKLIDHLLAETQVAMASNEAPTEVVEVMELPPLELVESLEEQRAPMQSMISAELAATAEGNPDLPPTERLAYRKSNPPHYPREARIRGDSGWVWLRVLVGEDGAPLDFMLDPRTTTTSELLVEAAIEAINNWRFNPAMKGGMPVRAWIEVPIGFFVGQGGPGKAHAAR